MVRTVFDRVDLVRRLLPQLATAGLLAVFTSLEHDEVTLVYLEPRHAAAEPDRHTLTLADLPTADLSDCTGPTVALSAIELVRPDVPTKGEAFHRLDRMLRRAGRQDDLRDTVGDFADRLGRHPELLAAHLPGPQDPSPADADRLPARVVAELAVLSAPRRLAALGPRGLAGLLAWAPRGGQPVLALAEARRWLPADRMSIELRPVLRRSGLEADLGSTLRDCAVSYHRLWSTAAGDVPRPERDDLLRTAYALALEANLDGDDVDDLIAVLPAAPFEAFLDGGAGSYLYRRPLEEGRTSSQPGVQRLHLGEHGVHPPDGLAPVVFSFRPLRAHLEAVTGGRSWADLAPVLHNADRTEVAARTAWLLVEDLLSSSRERRARLAVRHEDLLGTMISCCTLFSLTDPWRYRQGRRHEWMLESYRTLAHVLEPLVERSSGARRHYYTALDDWFGCALREGTDVVDALQHMVAELEQAQDPTPGLWTARIPTMLELGRILLDLYRGGAQRQAHQDVQTFSATTVPDQIAQACRMTQEVPLSSAAFRDSLGRYAAVRDDIRRLVTSQVPVRDKIDGLAARVGALRAERRRVFAPAHQARVLTVLIDTAISDAETTIRRLRAGAVVDIDLITHAVAAGDDHAGVVLRMTNRGSARARNLTVELAPSDRFVLRDQPFTQAVAVLGAEDEHDVRFRIRVVTDEDTVPIRCSVSYQDADDRTHTTAVEYRMNVTGLDHGPFQQKANPYVFGLPLQEHRRFFGRREELEQILSHLADGRPQNVLLRGARRTGKTSLLHMVAAVLSDTGDQREVRSWFGLPTGWDAGLDRTVPVMLNLQAAAWPQDATATTFYHLVMAALTEAGLGGDLLDELRQEPTVTATQFVAAMRSVLAGTTSRPVVLVDEFDLIERIRDTSFFYGPLRHVISSVQGITWVVASALGLAHEVRHYESPLFNIFKIVNLRSLGRDAASHLVLTPWQGEGAVNGRGRLQFADDAVDAVIEEAGRHPYFLQLLCSEIVDHANATRISYVQHRTVTQVIEGRMVVDGSAATEHLAYLWHTAGPLGQLVLLELLRSPGPVPADRLRGLIDARLAGHGVSGSAASRQRAYEASLQRLADISAVRRMRQGTYRFAIPLLRRLLLRRREHEQLELAALRALGPSITATDADG